MAFFKQLFSKRAERIYLDFASSTPIDEKMMSQFPSIPKEVVQANPSALHKEGVAAKRVLETSREMVADMLEVQKNETIFTSGATESDSLAVVGSIKAAIEKGYTPESIVLYQSMFEHAAVSESAKEVWRLGVSVASLEMEQGIISPKDIIVPEGARFILISVIYVHNEIGTVQPIQEIAKRVRFLRKQHPEVTILFHVDATQAPLHFSLRVPSLGVDMMTLGATKLYCPKGVGVLYVRNGISIKPLLFGGGQERGIRPGTQPIELIHTFAHALSFAQKMKEKETERVRALQDFFEQEIQKSIPEVFVTAKNLERTPHITHVAVTKMDSELLVLELDARGIAVSAKSACRNEEDTESQIVTTLYGEGVGAVRFSFGRTTTKSDVLKAVQALASVIEKYRK